MRWGSFDPFILEDTFWQDRMGMPVANKEFLRAMLRYGSLESYHFFCEDSNHLRQVSRALERIVPEEESRKRIKLSLQALFLEELGRNAVDVMHHGDFTYYMPCLMELRNRLSSTFPFPVSGVTHSLDTAAMYTRYQQILLAEPQPFDTIICTSRCAVEMLTKTFDHIRESFSESFGAKLPGPPSLVNIPLGLSEDVFATREKSLCRQEMGIPGHHVVMLSLARFSPRRKMDLAPLLECISWLKRKKDKGDRALPDFTLILAGAGRASDLELVHDMVVQLDLHENVRVESNVSIERKRLLYGAADVFLSMVDNYQETFGLTIIEAMAQGIPVVASDFNGYKELVSHGRTGFLIPTCVSSSQEPWEPLQGLLNSSILRFYQAQKVSFDIEELARALLALAESPGLRQAMGVRARAKALSYQWRWIVPLYEELWRNQKKKAQNAVRSNWPRQKSPPLLIPSTKKSFSHYPTKCLHSDSRVTLSNYGRECIEERFRPVMYEEMSLLMNNMCQTHMLDCLAKREWSITELFDECRLKTGFSLEIIQLHLDWLVKHGHVAILL